MKIVSLENVIVYFVNYENLKLRTHPKKCMHEIDLKRIKVEEIIVERSNFRKAININVHKYLRIDVLLKNTVSSIKVSMLYTNNRANFIIQNFYRLSDDADDWCERGWRDCTRFVRISTQGIKKNDDNQSGFLCREN